ncbi:hypothetical protein K1719_017864 [Acacia pycnantha]|nr:hypothetical protein K1719_017864 [Acacia pycnantha]
MWEDVAQVDWHNAFTVIARQLVFQEAFCGVVTLQKISNILLLFPPSFEKRSSNPAKDFQYAVRQALQRKEQLSSCIKSSPQRTVRLDLQAKLTHVL